jgi:hypothetical protein
MQVSVSIVTWESYSVDQQCQHIACHFLCNRWFNVKVEDSQLLKLVWCSSMCYRANSEQDTSLYLAVVSSLWETVTDGHC